MSQAASSSSSSSSSSTAPSSQPAFYPVFLKLAGRRVLVVGGGPVAASKLQGLIDAGAEVTLVAPDIVPEIERLAARADLSSRLTLHRRAFDAADLDGVWFVVAAATREVNREVSRTAEARQLFVNAVDDPPNATAYLGGVIRRGGVTVAISTDGHAPALAGLLREGLDALLPHELDAWLTDARAIRRTWLANGVPMEERRPLLLQALNEIYARRARANAPDAPASLLDTLKGTAAPEPVGAASVEVGGAA